MNTDYVVEQDGDEGTASIELYRGRDKDRAFNVFHATPAVVGRSVRIYTPDDQYATGADAQ